MIISCDGPDSGPGSHAPKVRRRGAGFRPASRWLTLALGLWMLGCGGDGLGRRYAVRGAVLYRGVPVSSGTITFHPIDPSGRVAAGSIRNGSYSLTTLSLDDGAFPGDYVVTVVSKAATRPGAGIDGGRVSQSRIAEATKAAKDLIPRRYQWSQTSGLKAQVGPKSNRIEFNLGD